MESLLSQMKQVMMYLNTKEIFDEVKIDITDTVIDRAHRTGSEYSHYETKKKVKAIIVRFTRFRHKTSVHSEKKTIRYNVKIHLDLTKERQTLLLEGNDIVRGSNDVKLCFGEINCRLKIMSEDELWPGSFFSSLEDLLGKLPVN